MKKFLVLALFLGAILLPLLEALPQSGVGGGAQSGIGGGVPTILGQITSYNGVTTAGIGVTPVVAYQSTTPTTPVGSTNILASAPVGLYSISVYAVVTTSGVGGTNFIFNLTYTDAQQAQTIAEFTNTTFTAGNVNQFTAVVQNQAIGNISYTLTETGTFTTHPVIRLFIVAERLQ